MFEGDSLSVLLFLLGTALAGMMGAIAAPAGWRAKTLWGFAGVFALAAVAWLAVPSASPAIKAVSPFLTALAQSNVWMMVATVAVVALMVGRRAGYQPVPIPNEQPENPEGQDRERKRVVRALTETFVSSGHVYTNVPQSGRKRAAERALPGTRAALLSAHKQFGIPLPFEVENPELALEFHRRLIEKILPYLREGHANEACEEAQRFINDMRPNPPVEVTA